MLRAMRLRQNNVLLRRVLSRFARSAVIIEIYLAALRRRRRIRSAERERTPGAVDGAPVIVANSATR